MKYVAMLLAAMAITGAAQAAKYVDGYTKKDGTQV